MDQFAQGFAQFPLFLLQKARQGVQGHPLGDIQRLEGVGIPLEVAGGFQPVAPLGGHPGKEAAADHQSDACDAEDRLLHRAGQKQFGGRQAGDAADEKAEGHQPAHNAHGQPGAEPLAGAGPDLHLRPPALVRVQNRPGPAGHFGALGAPGAGLFCAGVLGAVIVGRAGRAFALGFPLGLVLIQGPARLGQAEIDGIHHRPAHAVGPVPQLLAPTLKAVLERVRYRNAKLSQLALQLLLDLRARLGGAGFFSLLIFHSHPYPSVGQYRPHTAPATRSPSTAALIMPPAYPAPSPQG